MFIFSSLLGATTVGLLSLSTFTQAAPQPQWQQGGSEWQASSAATEATGLAVNSYAPEATSSAVNAFATAGSSTIGSTDATAVSQAAGATGTTACNNSPELCERNYNNITHIGAHDVAFLRDSADSFSSSGNQFYNATLALSAGLRLLQAQVHSLNGTLELCHTSCSLLDAGSLKDFLSDIKYWMDKNPNEVVTLLLVNSDTNSTETYGKAFSNSGLNKYGYTPSSTSAAISTWPTLATLIAANTRLISFVTNIDYSSTYPYLLPEFTYVFETAYSVTSLKDFNCDLNRPSSESSASTALNAGFMGLVNHFADTAELGSTDFTIPDVTDVATTNSPSTTTTGALGLHGKNCTTTWGKKPTFMLVDFWNVGPAITTADNLNGITATGRTNASTAIVSASSSSNSAAGPVAPVWKSWSVAAIALGVVAVANTIYL